jgi:hypothetical protein
MNKKILIVSFFLVIFVTLPVLIYKAGTIPEPTGKAFGEIDVYQEPVQEPYMGERFTHTVDDFQYTIEPVASYKIWCLVMSRKFHYNTLEDKLSPVDLCVVWGKLAEPETLQYIRFFQESRFCSYRYDERMPLDASYVGSHVANIHIIPANENVLKAAKSIKRNQEIYLEGYLVKVYKYDRCIWESSVERTDSGLHACEVFYVTKVRIGTAVYE